MNAIDLLKEQHEEVRNLFAELRHTDDPEERETIFQDIADNLAAHAMIEETMFYPVAYDRDPKAIEHAVADHFVVKRLIADMISLSVEDPSFDASFGVLEERVQQHIEEEENELFERVAARVDEVDLLGLGDDMQHVFDEDMDAEPIARVLRDVKRPPAF